MTDFLRLLLAVFLSASAAAETLVATHDPVPDPAYPASVVELTFSSAGDRMPGFIYIASGVGPHPTVVLLHGFPGNEKNLDIAQSARRAGFNVVFFNYRSAWGADGSYSLLGQDEDVQSVLGFFREPVNSKKYRVDTSHLTLLGHSLVTAIIVEHAVASSKNEDDEVLKKKEKAFLHALHTRGNTDNSK